MCYSSCAISSWMFFVPYQLIDVLFSLSAHGCSLFFISSLMFFVPCHFSDVLCSLSAQRCSFFPISSAMFFVPYQLLDVLCSLSAQWCSLFPIHSVMFCVPYQLSNVLCSLSSQWCSVRRRFNSSPRRSSDKTWKLVVMIYWRKWVVFILFGRLKSVRTTFTSGRFFKFTFLCFKKVFFD